MMRFESEWRTNWKGHSIVVLNWWNLLLGTGEELWIDGTRCDHSGGTFRFTSALTAVCHSEEQIFTVRAHLWPLNMAKIGCHIYINDQLVGGDVTARPEGFLGICKGPTGKIPRSF